MTPEQREEWVARFVEECGEEGDAAAFLARHPEAPDGLGAALAQLHGVTSLFPAGDRAPASIGGWRLREEIGRGGAARVWRVDHPQRPGVVGALKRLEPLLAGDPRARERFVREAAILRGLDHPHVARALDAGEHDGVPWLVLELCEGGSLAAWLEGCRREAPPWRPARLPGRDPGAASIAAFGAELASAVAALHARGIVHRDLKPANVLLDARGAPVIVDFGLAARVDHSTLSRTGDLLGTVPYMAPEQARGERAGPACDLFGIGAILHELLTLEAPRAGTDAVALLERARRQPIARIAPRGQECPEALIAIVERALAHRPARRFADAGELARALEAFAAGRPLRVERPSTLERTLDRLLARRGALATVGATAALVALATWWFAGEEPEVRRAHEERAALEERGREARAWLASLGEGLELGAPLEAAGELPPLAELRSDVAASPEDPLAAARLAVAAVTAGDAAAAARECEVALRLLPGAPELVRVLLPLVEREGRRRFDEGDAPGAAERFEQLVALDPLRDDSWRLLALARARVGDPRGALAAVEQALALPMTQIEREAALRAYAIALDAEGMRAAAIEVLEGVVGRAPDYLQARLSLGLMHDSECRLDAAREHYAAALALEPDHADTLVALAWLHSGSNREQCAKCRAAFEAHPELADPDAVESLARRYLQATGGRDKRLAQVIDIAMRAGRGAALVPLLDELIDAATDDRVLGALARARRKLAAQ